MKSGNEIVNPCIAIFTKRQKSQKKSFSQSSNTKFLVFILSSCIVLFDLAFCYLSFHSSQNKKSILILHSRTILDLFFLS